MPNYGHSVTEIQMLSSPAECSRLRKLVTRLAASALRSTDAEDMELAIGEALSNAVKYGQAGSKISVRVESSPDTELAVELAYLGSRFDTCVKCPDDLANATGGFGRFIIDQVTDSMEYSFDNGCTTLRLTKR